MNFLEKEELQKEKSEKLNHIKNNVYLVLFILYLIGAFILIQIESNIHSEILRTLFITFICLPYGFSILLVETHFFKNIIYKLYKKKYNKDYFSREG